jgi:peptide/nickel transport system substrate-binding protein
MSHITRRQVVQGAAVTMALGAPSVHAQNDRQSLRFVAQADLKVLDPIWTTAYITRNHGYLVYDTLFGTDENLQIKPQMVDRTTVMKQQTKTEKGAVSTKSRTPSCTHKMELPST